MEKEIGPSLSGIGYVKGRMGLPSLRRIYSERGLGKQISELKLGDKSEVKGGYVTRIVQSL
jgi:hypothetical protein